MAELLLVRRFAAIRLAVPNADRPRRLISRRVALSDYRRAVTAEPDDITVVMSLG
jgi:hypothetical protein